jgi:hypothetical protein
VPLLGQLHFQKFHAAAGRGVLLAHVVHRLAGMNDSAVITAAKRVSDFLEGMLRERPREEHRDLPRNRDVVRPALARHVAMADLEVIGHAFLNRFNRQDVLRLLHQYVVQQPFRGRQVERLTGERGVALDLEQCTLKAPNVFRDILRNEIEDLLG